MNKYSGADWVAHATKQELSPLGKEVADILGQAFLGIYHIEKRVSKVDWTNKRWIDILVEGDLTIYDPDVLMRLVVLCHDRLVRMEIEPCNFRFMRLSFYQRKARSGNSMVRMPYLEEHIKIIRDAIGLPILEAVDE